MKRLALTLFLVAVALATAHPAPAAPVTTAFTYQGSIDRGGVPVSDSCTFAFKLFDSSSAGTQLGPTLTQQVTLLENGQFSTTLDFGVGVFDGQQRWLDVSVHCPGDAGSTALDRVAITATPYAVYALSGPGGGGGFALPYSGAVTSAGQDAFRVQNNAGSGSFFAIHGSSATTATNTGGVLGEATAATGQVLGVFGKALTSPNGIGVLGQGSVNGGVFESMNTTGDGTAVFGIAHTSANNAGGVKGVNYSTTGSTVGTWGVANSSMHGTGVAGLGGAIGGYFQESNDGSDPFADFAGVYGIGNFFPGVKGRSTSGAGVRGTGNIGVAGFANAGSGSAGVYGLGDGLGAGVQGAAGTGGGPGVYGTSIGGNGVTGNSTNGVGVFGSSSGSDGVLGQSSANGRTGVWGVSYNAAGYGGVFQNNAGGVALYANGLAQVKTLQILGADLAESFPVAGGGAEPGTVLMIDERAAGTLRVCDEAYSRRVAGVVSGANGLDAAVVLSGNSFDAPGHAAVALSGRVWVKCDATAAPIHPGDLLTSSPRAGHAMRADGRERAYGATLGKAMTSLETGTGLVLVLVNLQ